MTTSALTLTPHGGPQPPTTQLNQHAPGASRPACQSSGFRCAQEQRRSPSARTPLPSLSHPLISSLCVSFQYEDGKGYGPHGLHTTPHYKGYAQAPCRRCHLCRPIPVIWGDHRVRTSLCCCACASSRCSFQKISGRSKICKPLLPPPPLMCADDLPDMGVHQYLRGLARALPCECI